MNKAHLERYLTRHIEQLAVVRRRLDGLVGRDEMAGDRTFLAVLEKDVQEEVRLLAELMTQAGLRTRPATAAAGPEKAPLTTLDELEELALACRRREMVWSTLAALRCELELKCRVPFADLERKARREAETLEDKLFLVARATLGDTAGVY